MKYRIDGVLTPAESVPGLEFAEQTISRIKVMSELDIAERRVPQDGRFKARRSGRDIDFRVSIMPSSFGEDAVLRILDKQSLFDQLRASSTVGFNAGSKKKTAAAFPSLRDDARTGRRAAASDHLYAEIKK